MMAAVMLDPVESRRLRLRPVQPEDLPDLLVVNGDDETTRYLPYETWRDLADAEAWYQRVQSRHAEGSAMQFVLQLKDTGQVVGDCLLFRFEPPSARAELGYVLGRPWWGQGLMREGLELLLHAAFGPLGLRRLEAEADPRNLASHTLLRRLGFELEGLRRERWVMKGAAVDSHVYGLLKTAWQARMNAGGSDASLGAS